MSMYSAAAQARAAELGLKLGKPNQEVFAEALQVLAREDTRIVVVTSDSRGSGKLVQFASSLPDQIFEVGIAEQNLVGVAAGLAAGGSKVFAVSPACFLTARSLEHIKNDVAYSDQAVALVGISAGVSYGALGTTHHSLHDFAVLRAINNIEIIAPADNLETQKAVHLATRAKHPTYMRLGKVPVYDLPVGQGIPKLATTELCGGDDLAFIASGETVAHALLAAAELKARDGLSCRVLSVPVIKPLEFDPIAKAATDCRAVITVEEHMVNGGLGEACASLLMQAGIFRQMKIVGIPDEYTVTGSQAEIFRHYGISMEGLSSSARALLLARS